MSESSPSPSHTSRVPKSSNHKSFFDRLTSLFTNEPETREDLKQVLQSALERQLLDGEALSMIEGVMNVTELTADDIMIPYSRMDMLNINQPFDELLAKVISDAHSRFPVYENSRDNILGILLAKDLLRCVVDKDIPIRTLIRPPVFIPESKPLNVLLREFRINRNHLAIVIDEHGGISGLVTIEDILEEIVGEIEDEYDFPDSEQTIVADGAGRWRVMAGTELDDFNEYFHTELSDEDYDTIGGWLAGELGHIPKRGDRAHVGQLQIDVIRADARRALWLKVTHQDASTD